MKEKYKKNILAIGAHPDDIEIGCGGTLAKLKTEGHSVSMFVVSDGSAGGNSNIRRKEQETAASIINVDNLFWGGYKDTEIVISKSIISKFEDIINKIDPDYIFVNSPEDTHQDHRHLAQITISATRYIKNVLFYETPTTTNFQPDIYIDLGEKCLEIKHQLLKAHKSQIDKTNIANLSIFDVASSNAQFRGTQGRVKYAEAFKSLRLFLNV
jgi:LmbE family N-acetylglucosaminyl deacetylase